MNTLSERKTDHVQICTNDTYHIESTVDHFADVRLVPNALPELDAARIDTTVDFLGYRVNLPLMISPMSGGATVKKNFNQLVATVARECHIACGLGSMRVALRHPELVSQFAIKDIAAAVPVIANIGSVQLTEYPIERILHLCDQLGVDALSVHLNCGQELFQTDGDRNFSGARSAVAKLVAASPYPIVVKDTGFGIAPAEIKMLIECGVEYIDIAGSGGANWIRVEAYRHQNTTHPYPSAELFADWGLPTAVVLAALRSAPWAGGRSIIASGGIRNAMHIAKSLALGASLTAMALPFARLIVNHGAERAIEFVQQLTIDLKTIMLLCGAENCAALRKTALTIDSELAHTARQLLDPQPSLPR